MRGRYPTSSFSYSFGPGPLTPAIKILVWTNVAAFLIGRVVDTSPLEFQPAAFLGSLQLWQPFTYMFLHAGIFHILFNMLALWMFGVELERMWGSRNFVSYYFITGVGAALITTILSFLPVAFGDWLYNTRTVGASGAIYGVLLAYGLYFPNRPIYMYLVFPIPAKYFVMIIGGISLLSSLGGPGGGVAHTTHLGGLLVGYLYLKRGRFHPVAELKYRLLRWRINRTRRRFDVYSGGRGHDDKRIH